MLSGLFGIIPIKEIAALSQLITPKEPRIALLPQSHLSPSAGRAQGAERQGQGSAGLHTTLSLEQGTGNFLFNVGASVLAFVGTLQTENHP